MPDTDPNLPVQDPAAPQGTSRFFTEDELNAAIEAARKQEKDKLYPTISKNDERTQAMQTELKELRAFQKKQERTEADRLAAVEAEKTRAAEAEMSAKELIERRQAEFEAKLASIDSENAQRIALMEKEIEYNKLQAYIQRRVNEESDSIAPELLDFIGGNTPEEVEASIARVKEKTAQIVENMRSAGMRQRASLPGVAPVAGTNGVGPMDQPGDRQLSDQDIKGMGMAEYAQLRQRIGMANTSNQGLFRA